MSVRSESWSLRNCPQALQSFRTEVDIVDDLVVLAARL
jgi:hypothetical protein